MKNCPTALKFIGYFAVVLILISCNTLIYAQKKKRILLGCIYKTKAEVGIQNEKFYSTPFIEDSSQISQRILTVINENFKRLANAYGLDAEIDYYEDGEVTEPTDIKAMAFKLEESSKDGTVTFGSDTIKYFFANSLRTGSEADIKLETLAFTGILAHELGHIAANKKGVLTQAASQYQAPILEEISADYLAGQALYKARILVPVNYGVDGIDYKEAYKRYKERLRMAGKFFPLLGHPSGSFLYGTSEEREAAFENGNRNSDCNLQLVSISPFAVSPICNGNPRKSIIIRGQTLKASSNDVALQNIIKTYLNSFNDKFSSLKGSGSQSLDTKDKFWSLTTTPANSQCMINEFNDKKLWGSDVSLFCSFAYNNFSQTVKQYQHLIYQLNVIIPADWEKSVSNVIGSSMYRKKVGAKWHTIRLLINNANQQNSSVTLSFDIDNRDKGLFNL